jgi:hypothetical protein
LQSAHRKLTAGSDDAGWALQIDPGLLQIWRGGVCSAEKMLWPMEIAGFGWWSEEAFCLSYLYNELTIKCVLGFSRFVWILDNQWKC